MSRATQDTTNHIKLYPYAAFTLYDRIFQYVPVLFYTIHRGPTTPILPKQYWFGLFRVRSPLLAKSLLFSSPTGNEMFQFPAFAQLLSCDRITPAGLPHSEIFGSKVICTSPKLIAAYHVLHRLREPRHPPCALAYFLSNVLFSYWYW